MKIKEIKWFFVLELKDFVFLMDFFYENWVFLTISNNQFLD